MRTPRAAIAAAIVGGSMLVIALTLSKSTAVTGSEADLVPFAPTGALACGYQLVHPEGTEASTPEPVKTIVVPTGRVAELARLLNTSGNRLAADSQISCPADFGGNMTVYLWSSTKQTVVAVDPSGCRMSTNGVFTRDGAFDGALKSRLDNMFGLSS